MGTLINLSLSIPVVAGWGVWLVAGLVLVVWSRRVRESQMPSAAKNVIAPARPKSGVRPPTGVRTAKPAPPIDAFAELEALLDAPQSAARRPGD